MRISTVFFIACAFGLLSSCSPTRYYGTVKFQKRAPQVTALSPLKNYFQTNPNPKIVLRTPNTTIQLTEQNSISTSSIFTAIEKEFLNAGFLVRDRGLFNTIIEKSNFSNYSSLAKVTDTDIILEITSLDFNVLYETNIYYDKKEREKKVYRPIQMQGASIGFKFIILESNTVSGVYKFDYAPCTDGCKYYIDMAGNLFSSRNTTKKIDAYEAFEVDKIEQAFSQYTLNLIKQIKN